MGKPLIPELHKILIKYPDKGPLVAVAQILLEYAGHKLKIDGVFGSKTKETVKAFQRTQKLMPVQLVPDGDIGNHTWEALTVDLKLNIVDFVVRIPPELRKYNLQPDGLPLTDMEDENIEVLRGMGADPRIFQCVRDCARIGVNKLVSEMSQAKPVVLLRTWSHGGGGRVTFGPWTVPFLLVPFILPIVRPNAPRGNALSSENINQLAVQRIKPSFSPLGSAEIRGCRVGRNSDFARQLANSMGVPVRVNDLGALDGSAQTRMEDESFSVSTYYPGNMSCEEWAKQAREKFRATQPPRRK